MMVITHKIMGVLSEKNIKRRFRRTKRNAYRYIKTTHPSYSYYSGNWYIHNKYSDCDYDYSQCWIDFFREKHIPIIDGKFPETFPVHLFDEMKLDKKKTPQLCFSIGK